MKPVAIFLCDKTGIMAEPWASVGYTCLLVDPQHDDFGEENILKFPGTVLEIMPFISMLIRRQKVVFVAGFPPCTDVAVSGARWWPEKAAADPYFQAKAAIVAEQCRSIGMLAGCPWLFENPVSAFSNIFGKPDEIYHPYEFSRYCADDQYVKTTCLWTGGGFKMPSRQQNGSLGQPDQRIFEASPGEDRANFRSKTPRGFSRAVFLLNCPDFEPKE